MEYRTLELNILSAKDLKDVNLFSKMDVYAVVSLTGDPYNPQKAKTHVHRDGGRTPTWNFPMKFTYNESLAQQNRLSLEIKIVSDRTLGDTVVGTVYVPLKELLDNSSGSDSGVSNFRQVTYQVRKPSGKSKGSLNFSYKVGDKVPAPATKSSSTATATAYAPSPAMAYPPPPEGSKKPEPVMAYPAGAAGSSSASYAAPYPPPQQHPAGYGYPPAGYPPQPGYGYGYPPQPGYGYPPQQSYGYAGQPGYGYPPQAQKPGKNKFGMGLGAGLLGGALGGLLIGDMVSDAGGYDAGYDAGFDDAGGFDF